MFDGRPDADIAGNHGGRGGSFRGHQLIVVVGRIVVDLFGPGAEVGLHLGEIDDFDAAFLQALDGSVAFRSRGQRAARPADIGIGAHPLAIADIQLAALDGQRRGVPSDRQEAEAFALGAIGHPDHGDIVVIGIGDEQHLVVAVEGQGIGCGAFRGIDGERGGDAFDDLTGLGVDHRDRVVVGAGDEQPPVLESTMSLGLSPTAIRPVTRRVLTSMTLTESLPQLET